MTGPLRWSYALPSGAEGSFVTAGRGQRPALADVLVHPGTHVFADARAVIARSFTELPGLTIAAVRLAGRRCVVGHRRGDLGIVRGELAAVAGYVWVLGGRRLRDLGVVSPQPGADPLHLRPADLLVQLQCLDEVAAGRPRVVLALRHVGETDQDVRLVDR